MRQREWIGVDLDGTLAETVTWADVKDAKVGEPIWPMVYRVQEWLAEGRQVRIFTARAWEGDNGEWKENAAKQRAAIEEFCWLNFNQKLAVTNIKDFNMVQLWDDRAIQVDVDTGEPLMCV